jgi:predicted nucleic acid-binding protein
MREPAALVVDASAAVSMIRDESTSAVVARALAQAGARGDRLIVPTLFWLEMMSSLVRRHRLRGADVLRAIYELDQWGLETVELDRPLVLATLDLVERHGLTPYDASYLAVAIVADARLLTFDAELRHAAGWRAMSVDGNRFSEPPATYEHDVTWPRYKKASAYLAQLRADSIAGRRTT